MFSKKKFLLKEIIYITIISISCSCNNSPSKTYNSSRPRGSSKIRISSIKLDSLFLEPINSSFVGEVVSFRNNLYFIDAKFSILSKFDIHGKFLGKQIGMGDQPNQIPVKTTMFFTFMPNGNLVFIGPSWDVFIFNSEGKRLNDYEINWHSNHTREELLKHPEPELPEQYSLLYHSKVLAKEKKLILPIASQHIAFNPTQKNYAVQARIFADMDIENGYIDRVFGKLSPAFETDFNKLVFAYPFLENYDNETMVMTFGSDKHIYIIDDNFNILETFGLQGRDMDTAYHNTKDPLTFAKNFHEQFIDKGHYTSLKYIKETNLILRTYNKAGSEKKDGLQIYQKGVLIGDVDVPKGFMVSGYISPYIYSNQFIDDKSERFKIYKIKL